MKHREIHFEAALEAALCTPAGGYVAGTTPLDARRGLFGADVLAFLQASQARAWEQLAAILGATLPDTVLDTLTRELAGKGALHVLRYGFKCFGKTLRLAYFAPNTGLNPDTEAQYRLNQLRVHRQVHYHPAKAAQSIDVVLALNGLPVATLELKNPLTHQTAQDAIRQYQHERDPQAPLFRFKERALVHFAVDPDAAWMTTRLQGADTVFLPFNRGQQGGAGNPPVPAGYRTQYLWEEVLQRDSLLDLLARFLHLQTDTTVVRLPDGSTVRQVRETLIFPRYHQLQAVRGLVGAARTQGAGHNYLIQHSAGSGKSNSIAWLAHRLASLHDADDRKVFDTVVVITDRRVLDQQLQEAIYQFEHKQGVVQKIDENTQQLAKALADGTPIVISTLQKFPYIAQALDTLAKRGEGVSLHTAGRRFAVIVDEAHSSQSGEAAQELRKILNRDGIEATLAEQLLDLDEDELSPAARQELIREMLKRPRQPNLSYFAFTATPKFKTLAVFNEPDPATGLPPFHLYSMKQAIEEKFILDVLANYTTYRAYYGLIKSIEHDPLVPKRQAATALARFLAHHPTNVESKVEVIVEHFRAYTRHKIGGRAKAMVVTGSRLMAVRYKLAFDKYLREKGYADIRTLVAFSGQVIDPDLPNQTYTEVGMNKGLAERELPERFASDDFQILLVADKYQTGFDQPLLHTMYVDKRLAGIQAVQTLSRLNRMAAGKSDTFVLDFVNDPEEIYAAFKPYYERTNAAGQPDPHQLYELQHRLEEARVWEPAEVDAFCDVWFSNRLKPLPTDHQKMYALLDRAVDRYEALPEPEQDLFKGRLTSFRNLYAFLSQIIPYQDSGLEKLHTYGRFLLTRLPAHSADQRYAVEDDVALKYYRLEQLSQGSISLTAGEPAPLYGPTEVGTGRAQDATVNLSQLIDNLNARFGTEFLPADQLFFDQIVETAILNAQLQEVAQANSQQNFEYVFRKMFEGFFVERLEGNEDIFSRVFSDAEMRRAAEQYLSGEVYRRILERVGTLAKEANNAVLPLG